MLDTAVRDIGEGPWDEGPYKTWVSKSDVTEFLRCPHRVYLSYEKGIPYIDFKDPMLIASLLQAGIDFEEKSVANIPVEPDADIESVEDQDVLIRNPELIRNHKLGIQGILDLVATEKGKLIPVEIKSHKSVTDSDRLELAFYWRLLEPIRVGKPRRKGYVLLNTGELCDVKLIKDDFGPCT